MVSMDDAVLARMEKGGKRYEILVDPEMVDDFKNDPDSVNIDDFLVMDEVFHDARGGERPTEDAIQNTFNTQDILEITKIILEKGIHAIRIEKLGQSEKILEYSFDIVNHGEVKIEDLSWMFKNFYFLAGLMLITPLLVVIYWNRKSIFRKNKKV
mgnify:CR=1 FL=1